MLFDTLNNDLYEWRNRRKLQHDAKQYEKPEPHFLVEVVGDTIKWALAPFLFLFVFWAALEVLQFIIEIFI